MDVVADRSAVFGIVIIAKDGEVGTTTDGDLRQIREEVVGDS